MRHDITLQGEAFALRPVSIEDAAFIVELRSDPTLNRFLHPISGRVEDQVAYLQRYFEKPDDYYFIVERLETGRPEGTIALHDVDETNRCAEWGRWVLRGDSQGAVESALLIYRAAFAGLNLDSVYCRTIAANERVVSFHRSCGLETVSEDAGRVELPAGVFTLIEQRMTRAAWAEREGPLAHKAALLARMLNR